MVMSEKKSKYLVTYLNKDGEEDVLEVEAYSCAQALFLNEHLEILTIESTVTKTIN